jgi:hypothetical protein
MASLTKHSKYGAQNWSRSLILTRNICHTYSSYDFKRVTQRIKKLNQNQDHLETGHEAPQAGVEV